MYYDYRFKFPLSGLPRALQALAGLRSAGLLGSAAIPDNMLGDPRDASGNVVSDGVAFVGRPGFPASSYVDDNNQTIDVPARGDPNYYYIHIRSELVSPDQIPFNPADYGLVPSSPDESSAVLGVWL